VLPWVIGWQENRPCGRREEDVKTMKEDRKVEIARNKDIVLKGQKTGQCFE